MLRKCLSMLLVLIVLIGTFSSFVLSVSAEEVDISAVGADDYPYRGGAIDAVDQWQLFTRECTSFCAWRLNNNNGVAFTNWYGGVRWGNAGNWGYAAQSIGITVDMNPALGSIAWWSGGHVAWVSGVSGDNVDIEEYNNPGGSYNYNSRTINRYNVTGYIHIKDLNKPANAWISASHRALPIGWDITFTFGADNATNYWIGIDQNGSRIITEEVSSGKSYHFTETGSYSAYVTAGNSAGSIDSNRVEFTVYQARNIGEKFTAAILHTKSGVAVTVDDSDNVVVKQYKGTDDQLWIFEREGAYKRYKITNVKTGKCLDVSGGGTVDDTNIQVWRDNGATAQRWYLRPNGSGYSLAPMCAAHGGIDMVGGNSSDGNNIAMWYCVEGNGNQIFTLQMIDTPTHTSTFNGHKYELYNVSVAWKEAFQFCEQQGGHLVTITSQEEQSFINNMLTHAANKRVWAGAVDVYTEGKWQWITGESFSYKNWGSGEPNNSGDEDYLMLSKSDGAWNDVADIFNNTDYGYSFICEYDDSIDPARAKLEKTFDYNNHRYEIYSGSLDWLSAKQFCEQKGGHLVTITTAGENSTIVNNVKALNHEAYWLGLTDVEHESKWHWITDEVYSYKNWNDNEPNNSGGIEDYAVYVLASGKWNDLSGRAVLDTDIGFICEYDVIPILGDADGDGAVTSVDVTEIQRSIAHVSTGIDKVVLMNADVDGNGALEIIDATYIQRYLAQMNVPYEIGKAKG
ncbi:MAG: RICIN domain-containing protein [Ruminococcus sp.]|nr:RICIN domain-containing protein [Ruminococcus sp.]